MKCDALYENNDQIKTKEKETFTPYSRLQQITNKQTIRIYNAR